MVEKNGGAVDAQGFAEELQEIVSTSLGIQRMRQDGRKTAQHVRGSAGVDEPGGIGRRPAARKNCLVFPERDEGGAVGSIGRDAGAFLQGVPAMKSTAAPGRAWSAHWVTTVQEGFSSHSDWLPAV